MKRKLTENQRKFCEYYRSCKNVNEAARLAGYKAGSRASLLKSKAVREELGLSDYDFDNDSGIAGCDEVLRMLTSVMRGCVREPVVVVEQLTGASGKTERAARVIEKSASVKERMSAAEMLARRYGIFNGDGGMRQTVIVGEEKLLFDEEDNTSAGNDALA
jgi:hypothetical protein